MKKIYLAEDPDGGVLAYDERPIFNEKMNYWQQENGFLGDMVAERLMEIGSGVIEVEVVSRRVMKRPSLTRLNQTDLIIIGRLKHSMSHMECYELNGHTRASEEEGIIINTLQEIISDRFCLDLYEDQDRAYNTIIEAYNKLKNK